MSYLTYNGQYLIKSGLYFTIPDDLSFILELTITSPNTSITLPHLHDDGLGYNYVYNYNVTYGDNTEAKIVTSYNDANCTHTYVNTGVYPVKILGTCETFYVNNGDLKAYITKILSWGNVGIKIINFNGSSNLISIPTDVYRGFTLVTSFLQTFYNCTSLTSIPSGLFNYCTVTDFNFTFFGCTSLASIPSGLFDHCTSVTSFNSTFETTNITSIPTGLFDHCTLVTCFSGTFWGCSSLTSIPTDLFKYNILATDFSGGTFQGCSSLTSIPSGLFDHNPLVTNFNSTFDYCSSLTSIPTDLFKYNTLVFTFPFTFSYCTSLTSIPSGLFDHCTWVTNFGSTFTDCYVLASIPSGLFDYCTSVNTFGSTFSYCTSLTSIPTDLFKYNTLVTTFSQTFSSCSLLTSIPSGLFDYCTSVNDLISTFYVCSSLTGNAPTLWLTYPSANGTNCFTNDVSLSNYYDIPNNWGGPLTMTGNPSTLSATPISSSQINIAWIDNVLNEQGYKIERSVNVSTNYSVIDTIAANSSTYLSSGLDASTLYWYRVRAYKGITNYSDYSNDSSAITSTLDVSILAPTNLIALALSDVRIDLTWVDNAINEDGYKIERSQPNSSDNYTVINTTVPNASSYSDIWAEPYPSSNTFYYKVRAFKDTNYSDYSNVAFDSLADVFYPLDGGVEGPVNLKQLFDVINNGDFAGSQKIIINVSTNSVEEETATLNDSQGGTLYNNILIYPSISGKTIGGTIDGDMIVFNGTSNVIIDGRLNRSGGNNLTISNTFAGGNAIKYIDTINTSVGYCTIIGNVVYE